MFYRKSGDLTIKERKFVKNLVSGDSKKDAVLKVYDTKKDKFASKMANQILQRPVVQEYIKEILDRKGLSLEDLSDKLHQSIKTNMEGGKPSQAVAADLLKFSFKVQDAVPSTKSVSTKVNVSLQSPSTDMNELKNILKELSHSNELLLRELQK